MIPIVFSTLYIIISLMWSKITLNVIVYYKLGDDKVYNLDQHLQYTVEKNQNTEQIYISYKKLKVKSNMWGSIWLNPTTVIRT